MALYGVCSSFGLRTRTSGVRISQGAPEIINEYAAPSNISFGAAFLSERRRYREATRCCSTRQITTFGILAARARLRSRFFPSVVSDFITSLLVYLVHQYNSDTEQAHHVVATRDRSELYRTQP